MVYVRRIVPIITIILGAFLGVIVTFLIAKYKYKNEE